MDRFRIDICLFPLKFALALGLEPSQMIKCSTRAFNGPVQEAYFHPITLILFDGKVEYEAEVGFSAGLDQDGCALAGLPGILRSIRRVVRWSGEDVRGVADAAGGCEGLTADSLPAIISLACFGLSPFSSLCSAKSP